MTAAIDLFLRTVRNSPDALALEIGGLHHSYMDLAKAMSATVEEIANADKDPGARMALCANISSELYAGYLALQALGVCIVPIDLKCPKERCLDMLFRCGIDVALVDDAGRQFFEEIDARDRPNLIEIPSVGPGGTHEPVHVQATDVGEDDEAYILFTSGSTGRPKGVPILQGNFVPYVLHMIDRYELGPGCRFAQTFGTMFDPFMANLFAVWGAGGTLVQLERSEVRTVASTIVKRDLSHWFSVCSAIAIGHSLGELGANRAPGLKYAIFGGEPFPRKQAELWHAMAPNARIVNVYGPTETTVTCTDLVLEPDPVGWPDSDNATIPIGRAYAHLESAVIDENGLKAETGELCIRGSQRFHGYLEAADNAGRFYRYDGKDKATEISTDKPAPADWYRTGDLVKMTSNGMVYFGRLDKQVKLLGHRVELGEVEAVMRRYPDILDVIVVVSRSTPNTLHAAYVGQQTDEDDLIDWMSETLPDYMVPRSFRYYERFPQGLVGKINLPAIEENS